MILPNKIPGLRLWMDAADMSTINEGNPSEGTIVYKWVDKSGSGVKFRNPYSSSNLGPTYSFNRFNGKNVISQNLEMAQYNISIFCTTLWADVPQMDRSTYSFYYVHVPLANKALTGASYNRRRANYFTVQRGDWAESISGNIGGDMFLNLITFTPNLIGSPNSGPVSKMAVFPGNWTDQNGEINLMTDEDNNIVNLGNGFLGVRTYPYSTTYFCEHQQRVITRTFSSSSGDMFNFREPPVQQSAPANVLLDPTAPSYKYDKVNIYSLRTFSHTKKYSVVRRDNDFYNERLFGNNSTTNNRQQTYSSGIFNHPSFPPTQVGNLNPTRTAWPPVFTLGAQWCPPKWVLSTRELDSNFNSTLVYNPINFTPLPNTLVGIQASIYSPNLTVPPTYVESHLVQTNNEGFATIEVGRGSRISGTFSNVNLTSTTNTLRLDINSSQGRFFSGGTNYNTFTTSQFRTTGFGGRGFVDSTRNTVNLGSLFPAEQFICEILYYDRPLNDSEHRSVMKYLKDKWFDSKTFSSFY
jgi:hypothetical protein